MIIKGKWKKFLVFEGERLLLVRRKHLFVVFFPILIISNLVLSFILLFYFLFASFFSSIPLFIVSVALLISIEISLTTKVFVDWYFHVYVLTTRKILEAWYVPLAGHVINDIMLDNVNCTEIDTRRNGFINELLDKGDVSLTFDRPTNQVEFILKDIKECYKLGIFLTQQLAYKTEQGKRMQTIWLRHHHSPGGPLAR